MNKQEDKSLQEASLPNNRLALYDTPNVGVWASHGGREDEQSTTAQQNNLQSDRSEAIEVIATPNSNDILLGRGKPYQSHPGNEAMRRLVEKHKDRYNSIRREKRGMVAIELLQKLDDSGARFLKRSTSSGERSRKGSRVKNQGWEVATKSEAYDKVCHALRWKGGRREDVERSTARSSDVSQMASRSGVASAAVVDRQESDESDDFVVSSEPADSFPSVTGRENSLSSSVGVSSSQGGGENAMSDAEVRKVAVVMAIEEYLAKDGNHR